MEQAGFEDPEAVPRLLAIWEKYVSEKPRPGYLPLDLSYSAQGTYKGEEFLDAEQITKKADNTLRHSDAACSSSWTGFLAFSRWN